MYNLFGAPGFLGAYNCGPGCYGDYLAGKRSLPGETRRYMASVSPRLNRTTAPNGADIVVASAADNAPFAATSPPPATPAPSSSSSSQRAPVSVAVLPPPPSAPRSSDNSPAPPTMRVVAPDTTAPMAPATVSTAALRGGATGAWTVQLGAFRSADDSTRVINRARQSLPGMLSRTQKIVQAVDTQAGPLYRARLSGLSQRDAAATCSGLVDLGMACFVVAPGA
jgi:D-alanyl-D-alanine carboxypeptidase